jgi:hypothetical protein
MEKAVQTRSRFREYSLEKTCREILLTAALAFATIGAQADDIDTRIGRLSFENWQGAGFNFGD